MDLNKQIEKWMNSTLEFREAEGLINRLIVDNRRLESNCVRMERMIEEKIGWEDLERDAIDRG